MQTSQHVLVRHLFEVQGSSIRNSPTDAPTPQTQPAKATLSSRQLKGPGHKSTPWSSQLWQALFLQGQRPGLTHHPQQSTLSATPLIHPDCYRQPEPCDSDTACAYLCDSSTNNTCYITAPRPTVLYMSQTATNLYMTQPLNYHQRNQPVAVSVVSACQQRPPITGQHNAAQDTSLGMCEAFCNKPAHTLSLIHI